MKNFKMGLENRIWNCIRMMYRLSGKYMFERELKILQEMPYRTVKSIWENPNVKVHGTLELEDYSRYIGDCLQLIDSDILLDIGAGDGTVDSFLKKRVKQVFGFDFSESKIQEAKQKNPESIYWTQSFLDSYSIPSDIEVNKVFSSSVLQYCKPGDTHKYLENSIEIMKKVRIKGGMIVHLDIPDVNKAYLYYKEIYGVSETIFRRNLENIRLIFPDGSYWHDMNRLKKQCETILEKVIGISISNGEGKVYIEDSKCYYRSDLYIVINGEKI